ncbi:MAG TPA: hydantoinase B/oxoprolinase family protein [Sphingomonadaceae bacterium]|nr:hydantoinase B/oxoprolinase family protein [Sphingomonadaceae bacterium]
MANSGETSWQFWADRGGTFTDVVALGPDGAMHRAKLLSEDPERYDDAVIEAMRRLSGTRDGPLPPAELRLGTTVATNALLERKGEPVLLAITRGFGDALVIGTQERPDIFALRIERDPPLFADVIEIDERVMASGEIDLPLDEAVARRQLQSAFDRGLRAIAIVLMHGWKFTGHEAQLAAIAREIGFTQVSVSHEVAPLIKLIARGETSVVDAYLSPVLGRYVASLQHGLGPAVEALYMQSNGGLAAGDAFRGKDAILSGPAGGIVGMAATAREAGFEHVIGFDMGGTSTDVSHYAGHYERESETRVAGTRIRAPMMRIHTVAAGGGSICSFDGISFKVGPESAGAVPGPACYRRGGPLAVTDCNVMLGKLQPDHFPRVFGRNGDEALDAEIVRSKFKAVAAEVGQATGVSRTPEEVAEGFLTIAVANMANAIKQVSLQRGHDVTRATLVSFGGAAGQHACLVADALGIERIMCHPLASVLSAYGMGLADRRVVREASLLLPLDEASYAEIETRIAATGKEAEAELASQCGNQAIRLAASLFVRPEGSESAIELPFEPLGGMRRAFAEAWRVRFGFAAPDRLVAESLRVEAIAVGDRVRPPITLPRESSAADRHVELFSGGQRHRTPLFRRGGLAEGFTCDGPALVVDEVSTIVIEPGWQGRVDCLGNLILSRVAERETQAFETRLDPVRLEVMGALFMAIAEEMGVALQNSASSVNIRERLDFSCAIFDRTGNLIANAPHMPVHLGSMGESVRTIIRRRTGDGRGICPGDAYALNAPYDGGTHLPDITVILPVFAAEADSAPAWFVAARGHHADIGGIAPGSMPPDSISVEQEGILLDNVLLVDRGEFCERQLRDLLSSGPFPSRNPQQNIEDLKAQIASCARGAAELRRIAGEQTRAAVDAYMGHVQDQAEAAVRDLIGRLSDGSFAAPMDNGAEVRVAVTIDRAAGEAVIDFTGSSAQLADNFNAPLPVVRAAVLYVVRTLIDQAVPMNEGCLCPIRLIVPDGSMLKPRHPAAVVAGNVETSQVITDALFAALGAMAASQGTMNNFTFGNESYQYYETIAGGSGAGPNFDGCDAIQTHMTNSRLTDPEVLESKFPVLLEEFSIRRGSGGRGRHAGGDGAIRRVRFLEAMSTGILSGRRINAPFGLGGGEAGQAGVNRVLRADGSVEQLGPSASAEMLPGDCFEIATPGGGGFGEDQD